METKLLTHQTGTIVQLTSVGFVALLHDLLDVNRPDDTEEFDLRDCSESDLSLVKVGAKFQYKTGYRAHYPGSRERASWLEFEGSALKYG